MELFILCLIFSHTSSLYGSVIPSHLKAEAHDITKRFADHGFEGHDVAYVLHENQPETFHRISRRDLTSVTRNNKEDYRVRLDLSSGDKLHLRLKRRAVIDSETQFLSHTARGRVRRSVPTSSDCYATGHEELSPSHIASVSLCDGLHGIVNGDGVEYYIHPVEQENFEHQVHVLWRRAASGDPDANDYGKDDDVLYPSFEKNNVLARGLSDDAWKTEKDLTIEMAVFSDEKYWEFLHKKVPGREDEYILITMAVVNALYGDPDKVGYNVFIKVKLIEHWEKDPEGYTFVEDLRENLEGFCKVTRDEYAYDMHFLNTGVTQQKGPAAGIAYVGGVCSQIRCGNMRSLAPNRHALVAHEIGHNLGFSHHDASSCPDDVKNISGSFMGGGNRLNFSPCNKWELQQLLQSGKGGCLFEETGKVKVPKKYVNRPRVFPGQSRSPDELCALYAGDGFKYFRPYPLSGNGVCKLFLCNYANKKKPAYRNIIKMNAPEGFPCGEEMYCSASGTCTPWNENGAVGFDISYLRDNREIPNWSPWPKKWGSCSRKCGTGVQIKERKCVIKKGVFLSPYCDGPSILARLCKKKPCKGDPETVEEIRQLRGDEVCQTFHENNVPLELIDGSTYLPTYQKVAIRTLESVYITSMSCLLACAREPVENGIFDGMMISGTPCLEKTRSDYNLQRFNIEMRCVKGRCMEFSDCRNNEHKDVCGFCGGDEIRCVSKSFIGDAPEGERVVLAMIPAGSTGIDVEVVKKGAKLELWSGEDQHIIGNGGQLPKNKYIGDKAVEYADTMWSFDNSRFIRADGPISKSVVVKLLRVENPIGQVDVNYILPEQD